MLDVVREPLSVEAVTDYRSNGTVEIDFPDFDLKAYLHGYVWEADERPTNHIINIDEDWGIKLHWGLRGKWARVLCGYWCVGAHFESIGPGPEFRLPAEKDDLIPIDPCGTLRYEHNFRVPARFVKPTYCSSVYKVVLTLTYRTHCKKPGPIAGNYKLPMLQFYQTAV